MGDDYVDKSDDIRALLMDYSDGDSGEEYRESVQPSTSFAGSGNVDREQLVFSFVESDNESDIDNLSDVDFDNIDSVSSDVLPTPQSEWRKWNDNDVSFPIFKHNIKANSGFKPPPGFDRESEIDYFSLFFTDDLFNQIVQETNTYAKETIQKNTPLTQNSAWRTWVDCTVTEMRAFIGVIINMALNPKPTIQDYFSTENLDCQPFFKSIFSRERFMQLFWALHLGPPQGTGPVLGTLTRSGKVRRFLQYLETKFQEHFCPSDKLSIDESTIGFKGRVSFKVYNKDKPNKWGLKIFVVSDAVCGYICCMEPYMGSNSTSQLERPDLLVTSRIVLSLVKKLENAYGDIQGFHVFTDRYYTSVELAKELYIKKVHLTGTINRNRKGLPQDIRKKPKLRKGEVLSLRKDATVEDPSFINVLEWKDKRAVTMLTTAYDNKTETVKRTVKGGREESVEKPVVICRYNDYMGGVDLADHFISSYAFTRKSLKWWRKIFFWSLEVAIVNSFIIFNTSRPPGARPVKQRLFRKKLIKNLVGDVRNRTSLKRGRSSGTEDEVRLSARLHVPEFLEATKSKDCIVCSQRSTPGGRKRTRLYCDTCPNKPGLHPGDCFKRFHTMKNYKK